MTCPPHYITILINTHHHGVLVDAHSERLGVAEWLVGGGERAAGGEGGALPDTAARAVGLGAGAAAGASVPTAPRWTQELNAQTYAHLLELHAGAATRVEQWLPLLREWEKVN